MPSECTEYYGIIFDLDDTLLSTSPVYYKCFVQMMLWLYEDTAPHFIRPEEVIEVYDTIVKMGSKSWEVGRTTVSTDQFMGIDLSSDVSDFPRKLVDTYIECCLRAKTEPKRETATKLHDLADKKLVHPDSYKMMPNAMKVLKYLVSRNNVRLFLITAGTEKLQRPKIEKRTIFNYFDKIRILSIDKIHGKGEVIKEWKEEYDYITEWIVVGDSVPIDINPALANGCFAIHVVDNQCHLAKGDLIAVPDIKERYIKAEDMSEVYDLLARGLLNAHSEVPFEERARSLCGLKEALSQHSHRS